MKSNPWFKYLGYILLIIGFIYLDGYVGKQQYIYQSEQFKINSVYLVISIFIKIGIGSLLGLEYLINEMKNKGTWRINLPKIVLMVIPSLYFSISYLFMNNISSFASVFQVILGFYFITSFYKQNKNIEKKTKI